MKPTKPANDVEELHNGTPILQVRDLQTVFFSRTRDVPAVNNLSFDLRRGETLGLVGESGCGKSVTSLSILRLIPPRSGRIADGSVIYNGTNLMDLDMDEMRKIRGAEISMIFQEPMTALNPVLTVGQQIVENILLHEDVSKAEARNRAIEKLKMVHIPEASRRVDNYPHELSGGMRQRAMIAMALACNPKVLIADEPTTALDVTIQAQILELLRELQDLLGTAIIMITHDLGVIAETAHRVVVMYAGSKVEETDVVSLFANPLHPYTQGLLKAIPGMEEKRGPDGKRRKLYAIEGTVPALTDLPPGCAFAPRCPRAADICRSQVPPVEEKLPRHFVACWNAEGTGA